MYSRYQYFCIFSILTLRQSKHFAVAIEGFFSGDRNGNRRITKCRTRFYLILFLSLLFYLSFNNKTAAIILYSEDIISIFLLVQQKLIEKNCFTLCQQRRFVFLTFRWFLEARFVCSGNCNRIFEIKITSVATHSITSA